MGARLALWVGAALVALAVGTAPLRAETPKDGLVMADFIDDMISLDPAEVFEFSAAEVQAQIYDRLVTYPADDVSKLEGLVAESWSVSDDGKQVTFKIRPGHQVPLRQPADRQGRRLLAAARGQAQPVAGLHPDPVRLHAREHGRDDQGHRRQHARPDPGQALRADLPALLPDRRRRLGGRHASWSQEHEKDGDMGHDWLKTNSAGSGPFKLRAWKPNESVALDANPDYWRGAPKFKRVVTRHIPEPRDPAPAAGEGRHRHRPQALARGPGGGQRRTRTSRSSSSPKGAIWYSA